MSYAAAATLALRMVQTKGRVLTYTRPSEAVDPVTQAGAGAPTTYRLPSIGFPVSAGKASMIFGQGASNVNKARLSMTAAMKGSTVRPAIGDRFTWGGTPMRIVTEPELLDPDGSGAPVIATFIAEAGG